MSLLPADIPLDFVSETPRAHSHWAEALQMSTLLIALHHQVKLRPPSTPQTWQPVGLISISRWRFFLKLWDFSWLQFRKLHHEECSREAIQVQLLSKLNILNTEQPQEACADKAQSSRSWTCTTVTYTKVCYRRQNISWDCEELHFWEIWGSCSSVAEVAGLPGCSTVSFYEMFLKFKRIVVPLSSR